MMILYLRVETLKNQNLLDGVYLSTALDKNVKKMHVVWIILEYFPLQPGSLKILVVHIWEYFPREVR